MTAPFGLFGTTQTDLTASGFFRWFNLVDEDQLGPGGGSGKEAANEAKKLGETIYRPSGDAFRRLVFFRCRTNLGRALQSLDLNIARAFIDDPRQSPFARDIAKSFLESIEQPVPPLLEQLIADISYRDLRGVIMRGAAPTLPATPTAGYLIFATPVRQAWSRKLTILELTIQNVFGADAGMDSTRDPGAFSLRVDLA
jgi:hypothetical protein